MKYQDFIKSIIAGKIAPVYFFYGEESYLIEEGVDKIQSKFVTPGSVNFNRDIFYGDDSDASQIVNTALSIPMLAERRVVIVRNFSRISQGGKERILKYSRHPSPQSILILISSTVDFRKKIYIGFKETAQLVECRPLYDNQVPVYLQHYTRDRGKTIRIDAIKLLQAKLGNSLRDLINETEKLIHFVRDKNEISVDDVEQLVGISRNYNIFQLWDALGTKELSKSLLILRQMLETGESPVFIVSSLTNYFLRLWRIQELKRKNVNDNGIGKVLHIHPYFLTSIIQQAKSYSGQGIKNIMELLLTADTQLKTSYQIPKIVLELLIFRILNKKQAA